MTGIIREYFNKQFLFVSVLNLPFLIVNVQEESEIEKNGKTKLYFLHANAFLPVLVMIICLAVLDDIVLAIFTFQILCMIILPAM